MGESTDTAIASKDPEDEDVDLEPNHPPSKTPERKPKIELERVVKRFNESHQKKEDDKE